MKKYLLSFLLLFLFFPSALFSWTITDDMDDGGTHDFYHGYTSTDYAHSGTRSFKKTMTSGEENVGQWAYTLGSRMTSGELWVRVYVYVPAGFNWTADPITKILRVAVINSSGGGDGYTSILATRQSNYGCGASTTFGYMVTGAEINSLQSPPPICQNKNTGDGGAYFSTGTWHSIELYNKVSATAGVTRAWMDGILRNEYTYPTINTGGYFPIDESDNSEWYSNHLLGWWNGGPAQTQSIYFDDLRLTNEQPTNVDAAGNHMIGPTDWEGGGDTTPPSLSSTAISANGTTLTLTFSEAVTQGAGYANSHWDIDCTNAGQNIAMTYVSGNTTATHVYNLGSRIIYAGDTCNIDFSGTANSEEDGAGNDLAAIVNGTVTNSSTQAPNRLGNKWWWAKNPIGGIMKKIIFALLFVLIPAMCFGASVPIKWDATAGATGYRIEQCLADPAVGPWTVNKDVPGGTVLSTTVTLPDTGTIHLRLVPYNATSSTPRTNAGVWFNFTLTPLPPGQGFAIP